MQFFTDSHTNSGCYLNGNVEVGIVDRSPNLFGVVLDHQSTGGANGRALTAAYASRLGKRNVEGGADGHMRTTVCKVDGTDVLDFVTYTNTVTAQDALCIVLHDGNGRGVFIGNRIGVRETNAFNVELVCQALQLALAVVSTGCAVAAVICKKQFQNHFSVFTKLFGVGLNGRTGTRRRGASSFQHTSFIFYHTHTACTVYGQFGMIAEGGHLDACLTNNLKQVLFAFDGNLHAVDCNKFAHVQPSLIALNGQDSRHAPHLIHFD